MGWADAAKLSLAFLTGVIIPIIGLIVFVARIQFRMERVEEERKREREQFEEHERERLEQRRTEWTAFQAHINDRTIHVDPQRDERRMQALEGHIADLQTGVNALRAQMADLIAALNRPK